MLRRRGVSAGVQAVVVLAALLAVVVVAPPEAAERPRLADLVLHNGEIWTNAGRDGASAVAIDDGRIGAVGSDAQVLRRAGRGTRVVDLRGGFLAPGFRDQRTHLLQTTGAGRPASAYRPTYAPHDPAAAEPGRTRSRGAMRTSTTPAARRSTSARAARSRRRWSRASS